MAARVRVRIPTRSGPPHEAVVVVLREGGWAGLGEAALIPGRSEPAALAAAEACARLDLEARRRGVRLAELLGGLRREAVECSALISDPLASEVARRARALADLGYSCFKLKSINGGGTVDQERAGALRWAVGRGARLRIDFNGRLSAEAARRRLPSLLTFGIELLEQPLPPDAPLGAWAELREAGLPVAADESLSEPGHARALAELGVGLAAKLGTAGGAKGILELARRARGPVSIGSSHETSIGIAAALHTACALPAAPLACGLATRGRLRADLATGLDADGPWLALPTGAGLGVELDEAALDRYRVDR